MVRVRRTDHWLIKASTIYNDFEVHQSCTIIEDGENVWEEIKRRDEADNIIITGLGKRLRKYKRFKNATSAGISQKIFRYSINEDRWTIWRAQ